MKILFIICFLVIQNSFLSAQTAPLRADSTIIAFGHVFFQGIIRKDASVLLPLLFNRADLIETVRNKVRNEELRDEMLASIDIPGFDKDIVNECLERHGSLLSQSDINWEKIEYKDFQFVQDTLQTIKSGIESGRGFLYFSYEGITYRIMVDKMAKLLCGWRTREFGRSYKSVK